MEIPQNTVILKHDNKSGSLELYTLNFGGTTRFANFAIVQTQTQTQTIKGIPKNDPMAPNNSVLDWEISESFVEKILVGETNIPHSLKNLKYTKMKSDSTGITNLAKTQGIVNDKNTAFAKIMIQSECDQTKKMDFWICKQSKSISERRNPF